MKYSIAVNGFGSEIVIGRVPNITYDYFLDNDIDIEQYASDYFDEYKQEIELPEEHNFIKEGNWYDCDGIVHSSGAYIDAENNVVVYDSNGKEVWSSKLDIETLEQNKCRTICSEHVSEKNLTVGEAVFLAKANERGTLYAGEFECNKFDPTLLTFDHCNIRGMKLLTFINYDNNVIGNDDLDSDTSYVEFDMAVVEEERT